VNRGTAPCFALLAPQHYTSSVKGFRDKMDLIDLIARREDQNLFRPGRKNLSVAGVKP
jgi:hypothetical protein